MLFREHFREQFRERFREFREPFREQFWERFREQLRAFWEQFGEHFQKQCRFFSSPHTHSMARGPRVIHDQVTHDSPTQRVGEYARAPYLFFSCSGNHPSYFGNALPKTALRTSLSYVVIFLLACRDHEAEVESRWCNLGGEMLEESGVRAGSFPPRKRNSYLVNAS